MRAFSSRRKIMILDEVTDAQLRRCPILAYSTRFALSELGIHHRSRGSAFLEPSRVARFSILRAQSRRSWYSGPWRNRIRRQLAGAFAQWLLTRRDTGFCTDRSLSTITFQIMEETNVGYCADRKTFSWTPSGHIEADGGNSKQTRRSGVSCFPDRL